MRRLRWMIAAMAALGAGTGVMPVLAACGGDEDVVPPKAWAVSVCQAVRPWTVELLRLQRRTESKLRSGRDDRDTRRVKTDLITLLSGMSLATDTAILRVRAAGVPAVDDGSRIAAGFVSALRTARRSFNEGRNSVATLPTDDPGTFYRGVSAASNRIDRQNARTGDAFVHLRSPRLDAAFKSITGCRP